MITINVIKVNEIEYVAGKIGATAYSVEFSPELRDSLVALSKSYTACDTFEKAKVVLEKAMDVVASVKSSGNDSLTQVLKDDLSYNPKTNSYHVISGGKTSVEPVHNFFSKKMIEANDKGLSPKPWLIFWVRLMRNKLYSKDPSKVETIVNYLAAQYVDTEGVEALEKDGYSNAVATQLSTFDQISITEEGILAAFKYVSLVDKKFIVVKNEKGEQEIKQVDKYERILEVDELTGEITKDELELPAVSEEFVFTPPVMGQGGDAFTSKEISDTCADPAKGHIIRVGRVHELPKGFDQVNTDDNSSGVKGLHLGGYYYVKNFSGQTNYLVDCLVAPEDIGAVCDINRGNKEGAIRCKRYMVTGGHFAVSRGMYHPSTYAKLLDSEWGVLKAEVIEKLNSKISKIEAKL